MDSLIVIHQWDVNIYMFMVSEIEKELLAFN